MKTKQTTTKKNMPQRPYMEQNAHYCSLLFTMPKMFTI